MLFDKWQPFGFYIHVLKNYANKFLPPLKTYLNFHLKFLPTSKLLQKLYNKTKEDVVKVMLILIPSTELGSSGTSRFQLSIL